MSVNNQEEHDGSITKKWWDESTTRLLLTEFKKYFELWRKGKIKKKKVMWQKITDCLNEKGITCTPGQVENRFKNLQRGYRRSYQSLNTRRRRRPFTFKNELSEFFAETLDSELEPNRSFIEETCEQSSEHSENTVVEEHEVAEATSTVYSTLTAKPRIRYGVQKTKLAKSSVDVLLEIKELIGKVEIRRQVRHEQSMRSATEKNELLKRKNLLLEQILLRAE